MVSLRRRRNLGYSCGTSEKDPVQVEPTRSNENDDPVRSPSQDKVPVQVEPTQSNVNDDPVRSPRQDTKPLDILPMPPYNLYNQMQEDNNEACSASSNISGLSPLKGELKHRPQGQPNKRKKRRRRKNYKDHDHLSLRGVYYKNTRWRAAIKVDQKQIHLGTVESQEEAARLYDRAAFMCGRITNFELSEEEKQELRRYKWEEFLAVTRSGIATKEPSRKRKGPATPSQSDDED